MNPRHPKLFVLLLSLFIVRSALPIGFMVSFDADAARLALCHGQAVIAENAQHDRHRSADGAAHAHHQDPGDAGSQLDQEGQTCPFAFAAAAPLSAPTAFTAEAQASAFVADLPAAPIYAAPLRGHPIRGPPALS